MVIDFSIRQGLYLDLETWIHDSDVHDKVYRVWFKNHDRKNEYDEFTNTVCEYMFITEMIILPDNDILIGMQPLEENNENLRYDKMEYHKLSDIYFEYHPKDNEYIYE